VGRTMHRMLKSKTLKSEKEGRVGGRQGEHLAIFFFFYVQESIYILFIFIFFPKNKYSLSPDHRALARLSGVNLQCNLMDEN
jgi:hypothetical protein